MDAGAKVGLGHLTRGAALAAALASHARPVLLLHGDGRAREVARRAFGDVRLVSADLAATLAAAVAAGAEALVVDAYSVSPTELGEAARVISVIAIDDAGRFPIPADLVVNSALDLAPPEDSGTRYLLGPDFALLDAVYATEPPRRRASEIGRVLVCLGGATRATLAATVVTAVRRALSRAEIDVVAGPIGDGPDVVERAIGGVHRVTVHHAPETLRPLMARADLAVSAGGVTLYELAATAVATVGVSVADNQRRNLDGLARRDALVLAGGADDTQLAVAIERAVAALARDPARRRRTAERARALVDGRGAPRVAEAILARVGVVPVGGTPHC